MSHSNSAQSIYNSAANAAEPLAAEGEFTARIRSLAGDAEEIRNRIGAILAHMRVPPPMPAETNAAGIHQVCIEDFLQRGESAHKSTADALTELEGLFR